MSWVSPCVSQWPGFDPPGVRLSHHRIKAEAQGYTDVGGSNVRQTDRQTD